LIDRTGPAFKHGKDAGFVSNCLGGTVSAETGGDPGRRFKQAT
jgi:hypothetical protein